MKKNDFRLHKGRKGAAIGVRVTHHANRNEVAEIFDDGTISIRLTSSSGEGNTNQMLAEFISEILSVPISQVEVVVGSSSSNKIVSIIDVDTATVHENILARLS
ncbi:MAG: DUF167 domain-containing protein [Chloroflexi bacterium]|nr:DUF167 domain-containing protein [Chloroflexota bacterium]